MEHYDSFNKSHAACYAKILYQSAWLKTYYPVEFYASLMTSSGDDQDVISGYIAECKKKDIKILPPDINISTDEFIPTCDGIRYRMTTISCVGNSAIKNIIRLKPILGFNDFMMRRSRSDVKQNTLVSLIKAGCFDFDNPNRAKLLWELDMLNRTKTQIKNDFRCDEYVWSDKLRAEWERDSIGMYLSTHPMEKYSFEPFDSYADEVDCFIGGEVSNVVEVTQKNGKKMGIITLNTLHGNVKVLVFAPNYYNKNGWGSEMVTTLIKEDQLVLLRGKKSGDALLFNSGEVLL